MNASRNGQSQGHGRREVWKEEPSVQEKIRVAAMSVGCRNYRNSQICDVDKAKRGSSSLEGSRCHRGIPSLPPLLVQGPFAWKRCHYDLRSSGQLSAATTTTTKSEGLRGKHDACLSFHSRRADTSRQPKCKASFSR